MTDRSFASELLAVVPSLRAYAFSLTCNAHATDDLVQETLLKAWASQAQFQPGSSMNAWTFTVLRNVFYTQCRKRKREVEDPDGVFAAGLSAPPQQDAGLAYQDFLGAFSTLPAEQREALILVGVKDMSYDEAASVCQVPVGTIKSRLNRARKGLSQMLDGDPSGTLGTDHVMKAALQPAA